MAEFAWEARARSGEVRRGNMEAADEAAVNARLRQLQLNPVKVKKKLKLNLTSEKVNGTRIYRITKAGAAS